MKTWLLCCLSLLAVISWAQRPDTPADYGCASIGRVCSNGYGGEWTVEGWAETEDGMYMSPEVDLSQFQNPVVIAMDCDDGKPKMLKKLYVSEDGITYSERTCSTSGLNAIPKSAKRVKIELSSSRAQYLIIGEKWPVKTSNDYMQELDTKLVTGKVSTEEYYMFESVPVDGDSCHHQYGIYGKGRSGGV